MAKDSVIGEWLDLSVSRVRQLRRENGVPPSRRSKYEGDDLTQVKEAVQHYCRWMRGRAQGQIEQQSQTEVPEYAIERAHKMAAERRIKEREDKLQEGELIPANVVELVWSGVASTVRARLEALPYRCAPLAISLPESEKAELFSGLQSMVREVLQEIVDYDFADYETERELVEDVPESAVGSDAAALSDSERVG